MSWTSPRVYIRIREECHPLFDPDVRLGRRVDDVRTWSGVVSLKGVLVSVSVLTNFEVILLVKILTSPTY